MKKKVLCFGEILWDIFPEGKNDLKKIVLFLKDNPSFNLDTLIDITAIDFPSEVFPTPGGPTKHKIGPFIF